MKKLLLLIGLLVSANVLKAQDLMPIGTEWHYGLRISPTVSVAEGYIKWIIEKDTVVHGKTCRLVRKKIFDEYGNTVLSNVFNPTNYEIFYTEGNKIYHYLRNQFYLLIDYDAQPGDTWDIITIPDFIFEEDDSIRVAYVDSVIVKNINGYDLKHFYITTTNPNSSEFSGWEYPLPFVEHIGGSLFIPFCFSFCDGDVPRLRCFSGNENAPEIHRGITCDTVFSSIEYNKNQDLDKDITIYPNPFTNTTTISINKPSIEQGVIEIFNLNGQLVETLPITGHQTEWESDDNKSGMYFYRLKSNNYTSKTQIMIKQ